MARKMTLEAMGRIVFNENGKYAAIAFDGKNESLAFFERHGKISLLIEDSGTVNHRFQGIGSSPELCYLCGLPEDEGDHSDFAIPE